MAFRSKFEKTVAASLSARSVSYRYEKDKLPYIKPMRITKEMREAHGLDIDFKAVTYHLYLVDFVVTTDSGKEIYIETKGRYTASDRTKMKLIKEQHPDKDVRIVFMRDNKINSGSKIKYSDTCKKINMTYAIGRVPDTWLRE